MSARMIPISSINHQCEGMVTSPPVILVSITSCTALLPVLLAVVLPSPTSSPATAPSVVSPPILSFTDHQGEAIATSCPVVKAVILPSVTSPTATLPSITSPPNLSCINHQGEAIITAAIVTIHATNKQTHKR